MDSNKKAAPFKPLGRKLKNLRDRAGETLAEASGAVEIDVRQLASFELGHRRPNEEILLLLVSHFGVHEDEAVRIWELAGYAGEDPAAKRMATESLALEHITDAEQRVLFTDIVDISVNNYGVVMNFMQSAGPQVQPGHVAKVGMSREHAKSILNILQATLAQTENVILKPPKKFIAPDNPPQDKKPK
jgi:transcriptional regulator with XRE-family HTH domain